MRILRVCSRLRSRAAILFALLALGATLLAACGGSDDSSEKGKGGEARTATKLKVGLSAWDVSVMTIVADALGYYKDAGLDVELLQTDGSTQVMQQMAAGNLDIGEGGADAAMSAMQQVPLYPFYGTVLDYRDWVVLSDSPIQSIADLKGTTIGISDLAGGEVPIVKYLLQKEGFSPEDYELVAVGGEAASIAASLEQKRIDSYAGGKSSIVPIQVSTDLELRTIFPDEFAGAYVEFDVASAEVARHKDVLVKFAQAVAKANLFCQTSTDACMAAVGKKYPELTENPDEARASLDIYLPLVEPPPGDYRDGQPYFGIVHPETWETLLDIFSSGDDPLIKDPSNVKLDEYLITDLSDKINDFDRDAVVKEAETYNGG